MFIKTKLAAGVVALSAALATSIPAQASSIEFGVHGSNGGLSVHYRDNGRGGSHAGGHHDGRRFGHDRWDNGRRYHRRPLTPWEVRRKLRHRGFSHIQFVDRRAPVYKARATNRRGRHVFLILSSRTGEIIRWNGRRRY
jgi:hypothetical protein